MKADALDHVLDLHNPYVRVISGYLGYADPPTGEPSLWRLPEGDRVDWLSRATEKSKRYFDEDVSAGFDAVALGGNELNSDAELGTLVRIKPKNPDTTARSDKPTKVQPWRPRPHTPTVLSYQARLLGMVECPWTPRDAGSCVHFSPSFRGSMIVRGDKALSIIKEDILYKDGRHLCLWEDNETYEVRFQSKATTSFKIKGVYQGGTWKLPTYLYAREDWKKAAHEHRSVIAHWTGEKACSAVVQSLEGNTLTLRYMETGVRGSRGDGLGTWRFFQPERLPRWELNAFDNVDRRDRPEEWTDAAIDDVLYMQGFQVLCTGHSTSESGAAQISFFCPDWQGGAHDYLKEVADGGPPIKMSVKSSRLTAFLRGPVIWREDQEMVPGKEYIRAIPAKTTSGHDSKTSARFEIGTTVGLKGTTATLTVTQHAHLKDNKPITYCKSDMRLPGYDQYKVAFASDEVGDSGRTDPSFMYAFPTSLLKNVKTPSVSGWRSFSLPKLFQRGVG